MTKFKFYRINDPKQEAISVTTCKDFDEATEFFTSLKNLSYGDFFSIYQIDEVENVRKNKKVQ